MLNKSILFAVVFAAPLLAINAGAAASDDCAVIIPGGWPLNTASGLPIAIIASNGGPTQQCASLPYQQSAAFNAMIQGTIVTTGGGDPVGDGRSGCHTTVALNTLDPRGSLPFATIEELPHDVNAMLGLVVSQWNQNWALETWNAVQVMASAGFQTFNPLTIRLRRVEVGGMTGNQVNVLDVDSLNNFVTHLEVLDQNNVIVRVEPNVNTAQLLQLGIATEVSNSGSRRLRLSLGSSDANPTFVDLPTTAILTLRYGVNAKLAANATTGARGWVSIFPCIDRGNEF